MEAAKFIIYITNWHFNPETKNPFDESLPNIGELLKRKSEEGALAALLLLVRPLLTHMVHLLLCKQLTHLGPGSSSWLDLKVRMSSQFVALLDSHPSISSDSLRCAT